MKHKKLYLIILPFASLFMLLIGWFSYTPKQIDAAPGRLVNEYKAIKEMAKDSPIVVQVEVLTNPNTINYMNALFSTNRVKIVNEIKGSIGNPEITILDNGGIYQGKEYGLGGMTLMHEGEQYLLFLEKYQGPVTNEEAYVIKGIWQGKIKIINENELEYVGPSEETFELQSEINKFRMNTVKSQIN